MTSKYLSFVAALAVIGALCATQVQADDNKSHHLIVGSRLPGDRLSLTQTVVKDSKWMRKVIVEKTFVVPWPSTITQVEALDQKTNGNGAVASILQGGPGSNSVTIRFKSQRGHGINFRVNLYARA